MAEGRQGETQGGPFADQFGVVLVIVGVTIALLLLVDVSRRFGDTTIVEVAVTALAGVSLILALLAADAGRLVVRIAAAVVLLLVAGALVSMVAGTSTTYFGSLWFLLVVATPFIVLRRILTHDTVTTATLLGAASVYLLLAMMFMYLFLGIDRAGDGSFFGEPEASTGFMYFSLVTITSLGYGDLAPAGDVARAVSASAAVFGQIYLVFIVARLVALYTAMGSVTGRSPRAKEDRTS
ncbi:MAG: hypothetical protein BMS9Abin07_1913 [Acidimicrobiia bacterium]|nr:MAG: hypothetical protein BMS9Abin07_1913 [Acidimicrobiia bacterium]